MLKSTARKIWFLLDSGLRKRFWKLLALMLIAAFLEALGIGIIPVFIAVLSDPARLAKLPLVGAVAVQWADAPRETILFIGGSAIAIFYVFRGLYLVWLNFIKSAFASDVTAAVGERLFEGYISAPYVFHLTNNTSTLIRNVHIETQRMGQQVTKALLVLILSSAMIAGILTMLILYEPMLSLMVLTLGGGSVFFFLRSIRGLATHHGRRLTVINGTLLQGLQEGLGAFKDTRLRGLGEFMNARISHLLRDRGHSWHMQQFLIDSTRPMVETVGVLGLVLMPFFLVWRGASINEILPVLALLAASMIRMLPALNQLTQSLVQLRTNAATVNTLHSEVRRLESISAKRGEGAVEKQIPALSKSICVEDISFAYPTSEKAVVAHLSLEIAAGTSVAFVGPTGAGKTTAVDLILGLLEPASGRVLVDGVDIRDAMTNWQHQIGYIPQTIFLLDDTIKRNIAFGISDDQIDDAAIEKAVRLAQLEDFVRSQPKGLDSVVGERGVRLSGGQRQRIGIARALYHDPAVLVMDEATAAVDNVTERRLMEALDQAKEGRTFIMIAHRLSTVVDCDVIYLMKGGVLQASGKFEELRRSDADFEAMAR